jgi:hypothetical protein
MKKRSLPECHGVSDTEVIEASPRARRLLRLDRLPIPGESTDECPQEQAARNVALSAKNTPKTT